MSNTYNYHHPIHSKQTYHSNNRGFTIVELLIVIVVIAILAAISIVSYNGIQTRAKASATDADLSNLDTKLQAYYIANNNTVPDSLEKLKQDGFGEMTSKMNWGDDSSTPRGRYFVSGYSISDGRGRFDITYWDYKNEGWTIKTWYWDSNGTIHPLTSDEFYADPSSGRSPCKTEKLEWCTRGTS